MSFAPVSEHQSSSSHTNDIESLEDLKDKICFGLQGHVWKLTVDQLAEALSAKTSNRDVLPLAPGDVDSLDNHESHIDKYGSELKEAVLRTPEVLLSSAGDDDDRGAPELIFIHWPSSKLDSLEQSDLDEAIMKPCCLPGHGSKNRLMELDPLRECSDMFGVPKPLYYFQAYHAIDSPTTNRLKPDRRSLPGHIIESFTGPSFLTARNFPSLNRAVSHALAGYYNMCRENYQQRDLSIRNILKVDETITTQPFEIADPNSIRQQILDLCKELGIKDQCCGFVTDGDMPINWITYFEGKHEGTRSGKSDFMSDWLLDRMSESHMHSPLDDFASLYFVTQWACVFRELPQEERSQCASAVREWQTDLAGDVRDRSFVTLQITGTKNLEIRRYGTFLVRAQTFLKEWYGLLGKLGNRFDEYIDVSGGNAESFRRITDDALLALLKLVIQSTLLES
ncbi:hypothetical protein FB446DRAFT_783475 [Lentinula raphanica]|nr:hypothetical protein FB446DRAFT_783475 [Lentinula raphanica]